MKAVDSATISPALSHSELAHWAGLASERLLGGSLHRVFVPAWPKHPEGFYKKLWVLEWNTSRGPCQLGLSLRNPACGAFLLEGRPLKSSPRVTRSGFDLSLEKELSGLRLLELLAVPNDRILQFRFSGDESPLLELQLIPARPKGLLIRPDSEPGPSGPRDAQALSGRPIPYREERIRSLRIHAGLWMEFLETESGTLGLKRHQDRIRSELRETESRLHSLTEQSRKTEAEPEWMAFAKILQSHLHESPCAHDARYRLLDFTTGQEVWIPADAGLNARQQMERFYHLAKRKKRRLEEASSRTRELLGRKSDLLSRLEALDRLGPDQDPDSLFPDQASREVSPKEAKRVQGFSGPAYRSREGFPILVGRNREENLDLTFKIARGNDVWLHVKGRPGSHAVILLPPGKTASLETLIDAAQLCLLHSGGRDWGKTEVDYTWRKHVKKIKNSSEVSYSQNRTLTVAVEEERILGITSRSG